LAALSSPAVGGGLPHNSGPDPALPPEVARSPTYPVLQSGALPSLIASLHTTHANVPCAASGSTPAQKAHFPLQKHVCLLVFPRAGAESNCSTASMHLKLNSQKARHSWRRTHLTLLERRRGEEASMALVGGARSGGGHDLCSHQHKCSRTSHSLGSECLPIEVDMFWPQTVCFFLVQNTEIRTCAVRLFSARCATGSTRLPARVAVGMVLAALDRGAGT